jgi:hypothetical protein
LNAVTKRPRHGLVQIGQKGVGVIKGQRGVHVDAIVKLHEPGRQFHRIGGFAQFRTQEAGDHETVHSLGRVGQGQVDDPHPASGPADDVPQGGHLDVARIRYMHPEWVGFAVHKAINPMAARILAGGIGGPGHGADRGQGGEHGANRPLGQQPMNYKDTLNLPKTKFSMKANLPNREPEFLARWEEMELYKKLRDMSAGREKYILHDGPPYANGHIHMGTALNKVLKDIIVRSRQMMGFNAVYVPGWDCHGLPIEHEVDKKLGSKKKAMSQGQTCAALPQPMPEKFIDIQREEFKRLGGVGDWFDPYLTMKPTSTRHHRQGIHQVLFQRLCLPQQKAHLLVLCLQDRPGRGRGGIPRPHQPQHLRGVPFHRRSRPKVPRARRGKDTAGDLDHHPLDHPGQPGDSGCTRTSSMPPSRHEGEAYDRGPRLVESCMAPSASRAGSSVPRSTGRHGGPNCAKHPLVRPRVGGRSGRLRDPGSGTGLVHTAPGHGREDYETGLQYGLEAYSPVDDNGCFTDEVDHFTGQFVFDANDRQVSTGCRRWAPSWPGRRSPTPTPTAGAAKSR